MKKVFYVIIVGLFLLFTSCANKVESSKPNYNPTVSTETVTKEIKNNNELLMTLEYPIVTISGVSKSCEKKVNRLLKYDFDQINDLDLYLDKTQKDLLTSRKAIAEFNRFKFSPSKYIINVELAYCESNILSVLYKYYSEAQNEGTGELYGGIIYRSDCINLDTQENMTIYDFYKDNSIEAIEKEKDSILKEYKIRIRKNPENYNQNAISEMETFGFSFYLSNNGLSYYPFSNIFSNNVLDPVTLKYQDNSDIFAIKF